MNQTLDELGWRPFFDAQISSHDDAGCHPVRVMAVHRGKIAVAGAGSTHLIQPYIPDAAEADDHPTVGDWLLIEDTTLQIRRILQRENLFKRRAPGKDQKTQLIAANVDTLFIVASCNQDFSAPRLERYLVLAREVGVQPVVVLTKTDLTDTPDDFAAAARHLQADLLVEMVDARDADSVARLAAWCGKGATVALLGSSGVGKSTLVNTLRGSNNIATQAIRKGDDTGRHTTTVREMHRLDQGGWLLDTPGMRELQLTDAAAGLAEVFDDIVNMAQHCRFANCAHNVEPGCAIQTAIADGSLAPARLDRWRRLVTEETYNSASLAERRALDRIAGAAGSKRK
ncbi:ribosome small subunit-dependent GTPase A [Sphingobium boeckii]|uniref:Small ribosomal subunit biogenesis GTPase RsgA n=1 Tax=Sphingobium boeckii TaxID=1082345 RepID=A0A7W9EEL6_9SPHN|nr:ribosome small subunit-dependent GTPase A [Sphingobium boeckii]MBB5686388.1 ribosome biogenesis GTPase [Sphingobium boeckii]